MLLRIANANEAVGLDSGDGDGGAPVYRVMSHDGLEILANAGTAVAALFSSIERHGVLTHAGLLKVLEQSALTDIVDIDRSDGADSIDTRVILAPALADAIEEAVHELARPDDEFDDGPLLEPPDG